MSSVGPDRRVLHGTAIALHGCAVLIRGASGAGKSDLALRCLTSPVHCAGQTISADLVADDQVVAEQRDDGVWVSAPPTIRDRIEIRGVGIRSWPAVVEARLVAVVDLVARPEVERLPEPQTALVLATRVPLLKLAAFEASAATKLLIELARFAEDAD